MTFSDSQTENFFGSLADIEKQIRESNKSINEQLHSIDKRLDRIEIEVPKFVTSTSLENKFLKMGARTKIIITCITTSGVLGSGVIGYFVGS